MQGRLTKFRILFYCLLDGGQFSLSPPQHAKRRVGALWAAVNDEIISL